MTFRSIAFHLLLISGVVGTWYGLDIADAELPPTHIVRNGQNADIPPFLSSMEDVVQASERLDCLERLLATKRRLKEQTTLDLLGGRLGLAEAIESLRNIDTACPTHPRDVAILVSGVKDDKVYYGRQLLARVSDVLSPSDASRPATISRLQEELERLLGKHCPEGQSKKGSCPKKSQDSNRKQGRPSREINDCLTAPIASRKAASFLTLDSYLHAFKNATRSASS
jgi:hypothetical protein